MILFHKKRKWHLCLCSLNEQKYQDVVRILDYYERTIIEAYEEAGQPTEDIKVHI